jgi:hypothetical protein
MSRLREARGTEKFDPPAQPCQTLSYIFFLLYSFFLYGQDGHNVSFWCKTSSHYDDGYLYADVNRDKLGESESTP